jgi:hypothetical protein
MPGGVSAPAATLPSATARFIEAFRQAYEATSNPLYALSAFGFCQAGEPLPAWIDAAIGKMATAALKLGKQHAESKITPRQAADALPAAMGFRRDGWNAFDDFTKANEATWVAQSASYFEAIMGGKEAAIAQLMQERNEARSTVFNKIKVAKDRGLSKG